MGRLIIALLAIWWGALAAPGAVPPELETVAGALPSGEVDVLLGVGRQYGLSGDALKLLLVIRKVENGGPGNEMGVASDFPRHRAHRYVGNPVLSLRLQARWAAGTIRSYFAGDLKAFARRYCPPNHVQWFKLVSGWMNRK